MKTQTPPADRLAALPMYDVPELAAAHDALWDVVSEHLRHAGVDGVPARLDRAMAYDATWTAPHLLLGQSCGLPIVDQLDGLVTVLGGFSVADGTPDAKYASKLVVREDSVASNLADLPWPNVSVAINGWDSLSGYVSLGAAVETAGLGPVAEVRVTGAHVHSIAAVVDGSVDFACIDGHTLELLRQHCPAAASGIKVIGDGPTIPCLPLIAAMSTDAATVEALRNALAAAATTPELAHARAQLGITGFVAFGNDRYEPIRDLRRIADRCFATTRPAAH